MRQESIEWKLLYVGLLVVVALFCIVVFGYNQFAPSTAVNAETATQSTLDPGAAITEQANKLSAVGAILQGTFGIAATLAGAYVAIQIAALSYLTLERQRYRDEQALIAQRIDEGLKPIVDVALALQRTYIQYLSAANARERFRTLYELAKGTGRPIELDVLFKSAPSNEIAAVSAAIKGIYDCVITIAEKLEALASDEYARFFWEKIGERSARHSGKVTMGDFSINVRTSPVETAAILRGFSANLIETANNMDATAMLGPLLIRTNTRARNGADIENRAVQTLVELGAEINCLIDGDPESPPVYAEIVGLDFLLALSAHIPQSPQDVESILYDLLDGIVDRRSIERSPFFKMWAKDRRFDFLGVSFQKAIDDTQLLDVNYSKVKLA